MPGGEVMKIKCPSCDGYFTADGRVNRCKCGQVYEIEVTVKTYTPPKKSLTPGQKKAAQKRSERYHRAVRDMIDHIENKITNGYYDMIDFLNDPSAYFDRDVMGSEYNNAMARKAVIKPFREKYEYCPF
jgi:hypothetical protein